MNRSHQRRVQETQLYYNDAKKYEYPIPTGTGEKRKYNFRELRLRPEKRPQWHKSQEAEEDATSQAGKQIAEHGEDAQEWGTSKYKTRTRTPRCIPDREDSDESDRTRMGHETRTMGNRNRNTPIRPHLREQNRAPERNRQAREEATTPGKTPQDTTNNAIVETGIKIHKPEQTQDNICQTPDR